MQSNIFRMSDEDVLTTELLGKFISKNDRIADTKYKQLWKAYMNDYKIFKKPRKASWKPDHRVAVNFAAYITDTFEGFFIGNPIRITSSDKELARYVNDLSDQNNQEDKDSELSSIVSIFGRGYEMYYVDEEAQIRTAYLDPMEAFMIYDEGIVSKPLYFVRYYVDSHGVKRGSISDDTYIRYFEMNPTLQFYGEERLHGFKYVPATEYQMNSARRGVFENVLTLIDEFNDALSEKCNDVSYFADAYLKILGATLDEPSIKFMRDNRVINLEGDGAKDIIVDFLQKPNGDETQEHLLDRLMDLIFITAMVCNVADDHFATSSGVALKYKLLQMLNLAKRKERKFVEGLNRRYRIIFSNPLCPLKETDWVKLKYTFTPNVPANVEDEAKTATLLSGITSRETQLSVLSVVDDVDEEMQRIQAEEQSYLTDYELARTTDDETADTETKEEVTGTGGGT